MSSQVAIRRGTIEPGRAWFIESPIARIEVIKNDGGEWLIAIKSAQVSKTLRASPAEAAKILNSGALELQEFLSYFL